jgi:amino-acid N-acetyltransferase
MLIRKAARSDCEQIHRLARECDVDYPGMEKDDFLVAERDGRVLGIVGLKRHTGCLELCGLGVAAANRGLGIGGRLVFELLAGVREDVYLATVIPGYFERLGFERAAAIPPAMVKSQDWCAGCRRDLCAVMVRRAG